MPFTCNEVMNVLNKLHNNKACGIDGIINEFLKVSSTSTIFLNVLTNYFNLVLSTGEMPKNWTIGIIKPLFKNKGSSNDPNIIEVSLF